MANPKKVAFVFGALIGGFHLLWSLLVLSGFAQALYEFIMWAHMIHLAVIIGPFDLTAAVTLVIVTTIVGSVMGYIGALVWNRFHR